MALAIALLATAGGIWVYLEHGEPDLLAVGGAVAGLLVALLGFRHLERSGLLKGSKRPVPRHRRLAGWPQLGVLLADCDPYRSGGEQRAALACTLWVKADCPPLDVTATLTVIEEVHISHGTTGSGHSKGRDTFMEALHKNAVSLVPAGEAGGYHGRIPLPTGLPGSFEGDGAEIQWRITAVGRPAEGSWTTSRGVTLKVC